MTGPTCDARDVPPAFGALTAWRLFDVAVLVADGRARARHGDRAATTVIAVLTARQLVQAILLARHRTRGWRRAGATVDALHGMSMILLAVVDRAHRRAALRSAAAAAGLCALGLRSP